MKLIPNFPRYSISKDGLTIRGPYGNMKIQTNNCGYRTVQISNNQKKHSFTIARLMALTYIPNPDNKPTIDHINRDRSDDRLENLRWADLSEQCSNKTLYNNNTSGVKNVRRDEKLGPHSLKAWIYLRTTKGIKYRKSCRSLPHACFEQFCHTRLLTLSTIS